MNISSPRSFSAVIEAAAATLSGFRERGEHLLLHRPLFRAAPTPAAGVGISSADGKDTVPNDFLNGSHDAEYLGGPPLTLAACLGIGAASDAAVSISQNARVRKLDAINFAVDGVGLMYAIVAVLVSQSLAVQILVTCVFARD